MLLPAGFSKVCRDFLRGNCLRGEFECRYSHPPDRSMIDVTDNTVTVCMDCIKGRCTREKCKYFHPPAHLQVWLVQLHAVLPLARRCKDNYGHFLGVTGLPDCSCNISSSGHSRSATAAGQFFNAACHVIPAIRNVNISSLGRRRE